MLGGFGGRWKGDEGVDERGRERSFLFWRQVLGEARLTFVKEDTDHEAEGNDCGRVHEEEQPDQTEVRVLQYSE